MSFAREALGKVPKTEFLPEVEVRKVITLEEMIGRLEERIKNSLKFSFSDFTQPEAGKPASRMTREEKVTVIVSFLAMLELVRKGILDAVQKADSEEIIISRRPEGVGIPTESVGRKSPQ